MNVQQTGVNPTPPETLPAAWYHDTEIYARERRAVFWTNWALLGRDGELAKPGDYIADDIAGWPVFVIRAKDGTLRGFHNVCRHRAGPLVGEGAGHCNALRCKYHGWLYDTDGALRKAPGLELGKDIEAAEFGLHPVRVGVWNGLVFACLDPDAPDLEAWLGDIVDIAKDFPSVPDMAFKDLVLHEGTANWKNYSDNSCEGYHVGFVHKGLGKTVSDEKIDIRPYENGSFVGFDVTYEASDADASRHGRGFWIYKFPCLLLHFAEYSFNCERVKPVGARPGRAQAVVLVRRCPRGQAGRRGAGRDRQREDRHGRGPRHLRGGSAQSRGRHLQHRPHGAVGGGRHDLLPAPGPRGPGGAGCIRPPFNI